MSLGSCVALYNGIESFCQHLRDEFDAIEKDGLKLTTDVQKAYASQNKCSRQTKKTFDYEGEDTGCTGALKNARESFRIGTYLPIIDTLIAEVRRRKSVYCILQQNFNFLPNLNTWAISDIENATSKLLKVYASDLDSDFPSEIVHFTFHLRSSLDLGSKTNTAQAQLSYLEKNYLTETFPNVAIILRIYLTLPVANTEGVVLYYVCNYFLCWKIFMLFIFYVMFVKYPRLAFLDYANPVSHADKRSCFWRNATSKITTGPNHALSIRFTLYIKQVSDHFHSITFLNSNVSL